MQVGRPEIRSTDGTTTWNVGVRGLANAPDRLWFEVPEEHAGMLTDAVDPAVVGLLVPAMRAGGPMEVEGAVTDELVHGITHGYQHILEAVIPGTRQIPVEAAESVAATPRASGIGTGFSGGIDSFAVIAEHLVQPVPDALRLTHLSFFNVGAMTGGDRGRRRFRRMHAQLAPAAERLGLPFIPVDSNLDDFFPIGAFVQTHGPRNLGTAFLLQGALGGFIFASTAPYAQVGVRRSHSSARSDAISMPLLETGRFRPVFHGSQYTRAEKTEIVAGVPESTESLHVCTSMTADGRNCSRCSKCLRTQLTLELAGHLDAYGRVFDLDAYRSARDAFIDEVAASRDLHLVELRNFARQVGFALPPSAAGFVRHGLRRTARKTGAVLRGRHRPADTDVAPA
ncbi:hypothetical protein ACFPER_04660 [Agromyces aurantiacus]|uniref:7-cyano-7-deazaguanine synthase n=1 Tax=Agromyces aurantiacus TaxID=165814 RepID=A0ABV9R6X6_9MICO|nr:hypothetical protein [Agromyces aurantiacus]MBM7502750.1 hypothetical protein [Agromyces aurantiacus]